MSAFLQIISNDVSERRANQNHGLAVLKYDGCEEESRQDFISTDLK